MTYPEFMQLDKTLAALVKLEEDLAELAVEVSRLKSNRAGALLAVYQEAHLKIDGE